MRCFSRLIFNFGVFSILGEFSSLSLIFFIVSSIVASFISYANDKRNISIYGDSTIIIDFTLELDHSMIDQIVVY